MFFFKFLRKKRKTVLPASTILNSILKYPIEKEKSYVLFLLLKITTIWHCYGTALEAQDEDADADEVDRKQNVLARRMPNETKLLFFSFFFLFK